MTTTCLECGAAFHSPQSKSKFCGEKCRKAAWYKANRARPVRELVCLREDCNETFLTTVPNQKFCSVSCQSQHNAATRTKGRRTLGLWPKDLHYEDV